MSRRIMNRDEALKIVDELVKSPNIRKHCLAAEAAMRTLARELRRKNSELKIKENFSEEDWGVVGLLHDADYDALKRDVIASGKTSDNYEATILDKHTDLVTERLKGQVNQEIIDAIAGHCNKAPRNTLMAKAIYAADELTGLIVAATLVRPDKKLAGLTAESVLKRMKEPAFARAVNREDIKTCESELGIALPEFVEIVLKAMKGISKDLGL